MCALYAVATHILVSLANYFALFLSMCNMCKLLQPTIVESSRSSFAVSEKKQQTFLFCSLLFPPSTSIRNNFLLYNIHIRMFFMLCFSHFYSTTSSRCITISISYTHSFLQASILNNNIASMGDKGW